MKRSGSMPMGKVPTRVRLPLFSTPGGAGEAATRVGRCGRARSAFEGVRVAWRAFWGGGRAGRQPAIAFQAWQGGRGSRQQAAALGACSRRRARGALLACAGRAPGRRGVVGPRPNTATKRADEQLQRTGRGGTPLNPPVPHKVPIDATLSPPPSPLAAGACLSPSGVPSRPRMRVQEEMKWRA